MTTNSVLLSIIHNKATKTYTGPEVKANSYSLWVEHWLECAEQIADKFDNEQLHNTANAVRHIIAEQKAITRRYWK